MTAPEGWYDDGSGRLRWWDGAEWTLHFADAQPAATVPEPEPGPAIPAVVRAERSGFPAYGWGGVVLIVAGGIVFLIGRGVYYSDPYYNNTTDPIGIGLMLAGGVGVLVGIILTRTAFRNRD